METNKQECSGCAVQKGYVPVETLSAEIKEPIAALIERFRSLPVDHKPDGWPAVQTKEITALLDHIAALKAQLAAVQQGVQQAYVLEDDGHETYLDGCESRFSIRRADGECVAWVAPLDKDSGEAVAREMISALNATHPTQQGLEPLAKWGEGVGLLWDVEAFGKWLCRVVSPVNWDAHAVYLALVRANYSEGIDVRQVHAAAQAKLGLDAPTLDDAWKARLLDGQELKRDEIGCGFHPELPNIDEGVRINELLKVFGIEWSYGTAESEMSDDAYEEMVFGDQGVDYRKWTPEKPNGEGWCLVAVFDTDDGPACWWVRAAQAKQEGV